jgi:hypothetical protein
MVKYAKHNDTPKAARTGLQHTLFRLLPLQSGNAKADWCSIVCRDKAVIAADPPEAAAVNLGCKYAKSFAQRQFLLIAGTRVKQMQAANPHRGLRYWVD